MAHFDVMDAIRAVHAVKPEPFTETHRWIDDPFRWMISGTGPDDTAWRFLKAGGDPEAITGSWRLREIRAQPPLVGACLVSGAKLPEGCTATLTATVADDRLLCQVTVRDGRNDRVASTVNEPAHAVLTLLGQDDHKAFLELIARSIHREPAVWEIMVLQMERNIRAARDAWAAAAGDVAAHLSALTLGEAFRLDTHTGSSMPAWTHDYRILGRIRIAAWDAQRTAVN